RPSAVVCCFVVLAVLGCKKVSQPTRPALEAAARSKLQNGFFKEALGTADEGYRKSDHDPAWSWKFRTLKAAVLLREGLPVDALTLLVDVLPDELPADIVVRKRLVQAEALCTLNRQAEAVTVLETAQTAISLSDFPLGAELAFQRGLCAIS